MDAGEASEAAAAPTGAVAWEEGLPGMSSPIPKVARKGSSPKLLIVDPRAAVLSREEGRAATDWGARVALVPKLAVLSVFDPDPTPCPSSSPKAIHPPVPWSREGWGGTAVTVRMSMGVGAEGAAGAAGNMGACAAAPPVLVLSVARV